MRTLLSALALVALAGCVAEPMGGPYTEIESPCIAGLVESGPGVYTIDVFIQYAGIETHEWDMHTIELLSYPSCDGGSNG